LEWFCGDIISSFVRASSRLSCWKRFYRVEIGFTEFADRMKKLRHIFLFIDQIIPFWNCPSDLLLTLDMHRTGTTVRLGFEFEFGFFSSFSHLVNWSVMQIQQKNLKISFKLMNLYRESYKRRSCLSKRYLRKKASTLAETFGTLVLLWDLFVDEILAFDFSCIACRRRKIQ